METTCVAEIEASVIARRLLLIRRLSNERRVVVGRIRTEGSSFEMAIGEAIEWADDDNLIKIYNTWPDMWLKFNRR